ncbi:hypothetical protein [Salinigranum halophilum]|jgi:hypothetical protein|uniref:hypothetical protein n=1 Tax=Salinigranum halophilum TaxID=2565931 RepID=UPI0010A79244|nr:hypothetical protein [Salinigranum halophilum]
MVTLVDFLARLIGSVFELVVIFITQVALSDPLSFISFAIGGALTTFALVAFAYLAVGALVDAVSGGSGGSGGSGSIGRAPPRQE